VHRVSSSNVEVTRYLSSIIIGETKHKSQDWGRENAKQEMQEMQVVVNNFPEYCRKIVVKYLYFLHYVHFGLGQRSGHYPQVLKQSMLIMAED
jgi:hypothetical protein